MPIGPADPNGEPYSRKGGLHDNSWMPYLLDVLSIRRPRRVPGKAVFDLEAITLLHGFLGTVLIMGLAIAIWEAAFPRGRSLKAMQINAIAMTAVVILLDLIGDLVYVRYRMADPSSPRNIILAGDRPWVHSLLMEFKEHVAHFIPLILFVVVIILFVYDIRNKENSKARKVVMTLLVVSLVLTLSLLLMGAIITNTAPIK